MKNILFTYDSLKSPNGSYVQEKYIKSNFPLEYQKMLEYSKEYNISHLKFCEQLFIYLHNIKGVKKCKSCDNSVRFESYNYGYKTYCSNKCAANNEELKTKKKVTNLEKHGSEQIGSSLIIREKIKNTMLDRYGVENAMGVPEFVDKIKNTMLDKYGVENAMQLEEIKNKVKHTILKKFGDFPYKLKHSVNKRNNTFEQKFLDKYPDFDFENIKGDILKVYCDKCQKFYEIIRATFRFRCMSNYETCTEYNPINSFDSMLENSLGDFITSLGINYIKNDRTILKPKELDIYIPSFNLAIEFNGLLWHSSKFKDKNYHLDKTESCLEKDIELLHIFEDEWVCKRQIVQSIIKNKLKLTENKIYARKCKIITVDNKTAKDFLNENHLQGYVNSKYNYGLEYNNQMIALMSFGSLRKSLGSTNIENHYELLRFCCKLNTNVIGGASKLFKHFIDNLKPIRIISYANRRLFQGSLYKNLGMTFVSYSQPNYFYINNKSLVRENRFKYRKSELIKKGYDKDKSEDEIMKNLGHYRIYDCGTSKYEIWV